MNVDVEGSKRGWIRGSRSCWEGILVEVVFVVSVWLLSLVLERVLECRFGDEDCMQVWRTVL